MFDFTPESIALDFQQSYITFQTHSEKEPHTIQAAKKALEEAGVAYHQPSKHHIKVGGLNFYPQSGAITLDGVGRVKEKGVEAVIRWAMSHPKKRSAKHFQRKEEHVRVINQRKEARHENTF